MQLHKEKERLKIVKIITVVFCDLYWVFLKPGCRKYANIFVSNIQFGGWWRSPKSQDPFFQSTKHCTAFYLPWCNHIAVIIIIRMSLNSSLIPLFPDFSHSLIFPDRVCFKEARSNQPNYGQIWSPPTLEQLQCWEPPSRYGRLITHLLQLPIYVFEEHFIRNLHGLSSVRTKSNFYLAWQCRSFKTISFPGW